MLPLAYETIDCSVQSSVCAVTNSQACASLMTGTSLMSGEYQSILPFEEIVHLCKDELLGANFSVIQLGHHRLLAWKSASKKTFIELTFERATLQITTLIYIVRNDAMTS